MTGCHDDLKLVEACRGGQTEAFGTLVQRYQGRLHSTITRLVGDPEDAQDVLQDAFIRAFEKLNQFHGDSSFYTWIYRIAINLAFSDRRKRKVRPHGRGPVPGGASGEEPVDRSPETDPAFALEREEREAVVEAALQALAPEHRAVVVLKDFDGRRYEEISEILHIPIGTVRSRLHRARCELRERLYFLVAGEEEGSSRGVLHDIKGTVDA